LLTLQSHGVISQQLISTCWQIVAGFLKPVFQIVFLKRSWHTLGKKFWREEDLAVFSKKFQVKFPPKLIFFANLPNKVFFSF